MNKMKTVIFLWISVWSFSFGQVPPTYVYDFDQCTMMEGQGALADIDTAGNLSCICGPETDALYLDGSLYAAHPTPGNLLTQNFTLSFYMRAEGMAPIQSILSNATVCNQQDSILDIRYLRSINTISIEIADFGGLRALIEAPLDDNKCWQKVSLVKDERILTLYINGVFAERFQGDQPIDVNSGSPFRIGSSFCGPGQGPANFVGGIDQIQWYDRALNPLEVEAAYIPMDEIITPDTLVFLGDNFIPTVGRTCAASVQWSPSNGLSSTSITDPILTPDVTTTYMLSFDYGTCTAEDDMTVTVVDPTDVQCDRLLLPTAFTPNEDSVNDVYFISNSYIIDDLISFEIMDRSGNSLYTTEDASARWDGTYRGNKMPSGAYVYKIVYNCGGDEYSKVGRFNLIR